MTCKIILDTDIGYRTDADDALALCYLLLHPECELLGVTTVGLRSDWRAALTEVVCRELGRPEMPIVAGADQPVSYNVYWQENPVQAWPSDQPTQPQAQYPPNRAVDWLRQTIREHPGQVTLVTIGQFTNLAALLLVDPEVAGMLKAVVSMAGRFPHLSQTDEPHKAETNVLLDPVAAMIATQRLDARLTVLPLDTARGGDRRLTRPILDRMLVGERFRAVWEICHGGWMNARGLVGVGAADPLTAAVAMEPELGEYEQGRISVSLHDHPLPQGEPFPHGGLAGLTHFHDAADPGHRLVKAIDPQRFHRRMEEVFTGR